MKGKGRQGKVVDTNRRCLGIVTIRYVPAPDAESRLSRAIDFLLRIAATGLEGGAGAKKDGEPPQASQSE